MMPHIRPRHLDLDRYDEWTGEDLQARLSLSRENIRDIVLEWLLEDEHNTALACHDVLAEAWNRTGQK
jgi:hypothetical protein